MSNLLEAFELIESNKDKCDFEVEHKDERLLSLAEQKLGIKFPPTYYLFLRIYGCGGPSGLEIYGIINENFENSGVPDSIWLTLRRRETSNLPQHFIIISDIGNGFDYCLDASQVDANGEYSVVIWGLGIPEENKEKVNEDFGEFLLEQVTSALSSDDYIPDPEKVENNARTQSFWDK